MHDPFEQSLKDMLNATPSGRDDDACLDRVLKTANRQVGAQDLFGLIGRCFQASMIAVSKGAPHVAPATRRSRTAQRADKAD
ncbi:CrfX protein [Pseudomonas sp. RIT-PI-S]|uniref:CrfX protein n=1 Tax=Pseudomonas sp. RIT-PI-S TaxID=3035295 RepID=UPI0021D9737B|nr:CrfX protein [Pseudomonas sp. RIT-PI-S]